MKTIFRIYELLINLFRESVFILSNLLKLILTFNKRIKPQNIKQVKSAIVLGNGPSLNLFLEKSKELILADFDFFVCNMFVNTKYFSILKPKFYFLKDKLFFESEGEFSEPHRKVWENIFKETSWEMVVYISEINTDSVNKILSKCQENSFVKVINLYPVNFYGRFSNIFYNSGLGIHGGMTVLHFSTHFAIFNRYPNIYLCGVDHDWFENYRYDNSNNKVYLNYRDFWGENKIYFGEGSYKENDLEREFYSLYTSLKTFKQLSQYATFNNCEIFRSTKSFVHFIKYKELFNE